MTTAEPPARIAEPPASPQPPVGGLVGWLGSTDHKRIGVVTLVYAFIVFLGAGAAALTLRTELINPGELFLSPNGYNQVFTAHGSAMIYLAITPIALAFGLLLVPLQVGAPGIAAPRLALAGTWLNIMGALVLFLGFGTGYGAGRAGWFSYPPLSDDQYTPGLGQTLWFIGAALAVAGSTLHGWTLLVTILRKRAPGMTLMRMPPFTWAMLVTVFMVVTAFPILVGTFSAMVFDRAFSGAVFEGSAGDNILYQSLFWFYGHPVVYVMFFPFLGAVAEAVSGMSGRRLFGYPFLVASLLMFAALSTSVWGHHMFTTGFGRSDYFSLTSHLLIVPGGIEYFDIVATLLLGAIVFRTAMLFSIAFLMQFLIGGVSGIVVGSWALDYHVHGTYFVVAHFHYTLFAGSVAGIFAGVYYWWPKFTGVLLGERLGKVHFALYAIGTNLTFFPMFFLGWEGMVRRTAYYDADSLPMWWLNPVVTAGAYVIALSFVVFIVNVVRSHRRRDAPAPSDPWGGPGLEWWTTSPPPRHNFASLPPIRSFAPMLDLTEEERRRAPR